MPKFKMKPTDYLVIGIIILLGLGGFWYNFQPDNRPERRYVNILVENELVAELSIGPNDNYEFEFTFGEDDENVALIQVDSGRIRMLDLGEELCPRGICSHTGWISRPYERIVCLPNRIMVQFTETGTGEDQLDGVTF